jgi:hypothetical protein
MTVLFWRARIFHWFKRIRPYSRDVQQGTRCIIGDGRHVMEEYTINIAILYYNSMWAHIISRILWLVMFELCDMLLSCLPFEIRIRRKNT